MSKPWESSSWHILSWKMKWNAIETYLKACPGWCVRSNEVYQYDAEVAREIEANGGMMAACVHGNITSPNRPCDMCWEEADRVAREEKKAWVATLEPGDIVCDCKGRYIKIKEVSGGEGYDVQLVLEDGSCCSAMNCCSPARG